MVLLYFCDFVMIIAFELTFLLRYCFLVAEYDYWLFCSSSNCMAWQILQRWTDLSSGARGAPQMSQVSVFMVSL